MLKREWRFWSYGASAALAVVHFALIAILTIAMIVSLPVFNGSVTGL